MTWVWIRRGVQIACLLLFVYLLTCATFPVRGPLPPDLFLQADLLTAVSAFVTRHAVHFGMVVSAAVVLAATVLLGRVFCGWVCPLGTCVDIGDTILWRKRKRSRAQANRPWLKYVVLAAVLGSAVLGIEIGWFLDPIPLLTRAFSLVLYPLTAMGQNFIAIHGRTQLRALNVYWDPWLQPHFNLSLIAGLSFAAILGLGALSRRFWCRSLCPLGALLGLIGRVGLVKRRVQETCVECKLCVRDCKMGAIPQDEPQTTKLPECILCFDCLSCKETGTSDIGFHWLPVGAKRPVDITRRRTIQALGGGLAYGLLASTMLTRRLHDEKLIRPPGAIIRDWHGRPQPMPEEQFRSLCARCGECMKTCITGGIQPAVHEAGFDGVFTPILKPRAGWCERSCTACGSVCPTGALRPFTADEKPSIKIGLASINQGKCLAWRRGNFYKLCLVCDEQCSYKAVQWHLLDGQRRPVVDEEKCTGCGICEAKCPVKPEAAITVSRSERQQ